MGVEKIPLAIPETWNAAWFRTFIVEVLAKLDTRNAVGVGIEVTADGNSVATLDATQAIAEEIAEHDALATAHAAAFAVHVAEPDPHTQYATDTDLTTHVGATDPHPDLIDDLSAASAVALTDLVVVSQAGTNRQATLTQVKSTVFGDDWDDLRFPAQSVNPTGAAAPPTVDATTSGVTGSLLFSGSAENVIAGIAEMPHAWKRGSELRPHIHWSMPTGTSDAVTWEFWYRHIGNPGDALGAWVGPLSPTGAVGSQSVSNQHVLTYWAAVSMTGKLESACLAWRIHRRGDTDAASGDARLYEFDIHYQVEKAGTDSEIPS